jgi:putative transposase
MKFNPDIHKRRSIRIKDFDYSSAGSYFVTVCVNNRLCLFGDIIDHVMMINAAGTMIGYWCNELSNKFQDVKLDKYVVMPNHFHGIIQIHGEYRGAPLHKMIQWFKTMTTNEYIRNERQNAWPPFDGKLWQRNYYEHIIRDDESLNEIREYTVNNPINWKDDEMFPAIIDKLLATYEQN